VAIKIKMQHLFEERYHSIFKMNAADTKNYLIKGYAASKGYSDNIILKQIK